MKCCKEEVDSVIRWEVIAIQTRCIFITLTVGQFSRKLSHIYEYIDCRGIVWHLGRAPECAHSECGITSVCKKSE